MKSNLLRETKDGNLGKKIMIKVNYTVGSFEALEIAVNSSAEHPFNFQGEEELSSTWILVARVWALFIAFLGIPGNILTASTIIYQASNVHVDEKRRKTKRRIKETKKRKKNKRGGRQKEE
ncbi:hypothetical protein Avbf_11037 [Armadillidium vulgare]|nr:hypothetical protein Avbf_11037 [Armadillidium vulgare]